MLEKTTIDLVRLKISTAQRNLQYVLDHPSDGFDLQRIRLAFDQISFVLSLLEDKSTR